MINQNEISELNLMPSFCIFAKKLFHSKKSKPFGNFVTANRLGNFVTSS